MNDIGQGHSRFVAGLFLLVFVAVLWLFWRMVSGYLTPLVLALVLATLFWPAFEKLRALAGGRAMVGATLTLCLVLLVVVAPLVVILTSLSADVLALYQKTRSDTELMRELSALLAGESVLLEELREQAARVKIDLSPEKLSEYLAAVGKALGVFLYEQIGGIATNVLGLLLDFGMMLLFLFGFFVEGPRLKSYLLDLSPLPDDQEEAVAARFKALARAVFVGNGVASVLQGVVGGITFYVFGIGSGILWGAAIAFFAFLPMVGASVVIVPAAVYLFLNDQVGAAIGFVIVNAVQVALFEYVVKTRLMAGSGPDQMNAVLVFFGIVAGISAFGLMGLFYGPLVIALVVTLAEIYKASYRDDLLRLVRVDVAVGADEPSAASSSSSATAPEALAPPLEESARTSAPAPAELSSPEGSDDEVDAPKDANAEAQAPADPPKEPA